ncbi:hypothetical protein [Streptomyces sp. NPDC058620]|uniref:hypothetical protein n=1 Tax=Streptomyces sp. NPDC058620 TaxID=3346560 RepID=UPI003665216E
MASENVLAVGNAGYGNTMINKHHETTAVGRTVSGSGLVQLPVDHPNNRGGGGSLLFSDRGLKTQITAVVWE